MWYLQALENASHSSLSDILVDFFSFPHDFTQGSSVFDVCLEMHPQVCLQLTQMLSINLSEAPKAVTSSSGSLKLFKAILILVLSIATFPDFLSLKVKVFKVYLIKIASWEHSPDAVFSARERMDACMNYIWTSPKNLLAFVALL